MKRLFRMRPRQMRAFEEQAMLAFEERALRHLREQLPEPSAPFSDDAARSLIRSCAERGPSYGLTTERQIMCYLDATVLLGDRFETKPEAAWAMQVLHSAKLSRNEAAYLLLARTCFVYRNAHGGLNDVR